jgi:ADP-ribose pyrophosphatase YjhB (NUDIX family)
VSELPAQIKSLLKKYRREIERIVHELPEDEFQNRKSWLLKHPERIVGAVGMIARKDGKFVLVRHTPESWGDSYLYWSFPGGGVKPAEDFEEAAVREFKEETGLDVKMLDLISVKAHINRSPSRDQTVFYIATFEGEVVGGKIGPKNPHEISEVRLFSRIPKKQLVPWLARDV